MSDERRVTQGKRLVGSGLDRRRLTPIAVDRRQWILRHRWWCGPGWVAARLAALAFVLSLKFAICDTEDYECLSAPRDANAGAVAALCNREYKTNPDPRVGLALAQALHRVNDREGAEKQARSLLDTEVAACAHLLLGRIYTAAERLEEATQHLGRALVLHRVEGRLSKAAEDEQALASALRHKELFAEALRTLDRCITDARTSGDDWGKLIEGYCHVSAARVLSRIGFPEGAHRELDRAGSLIHAARDVAVLIFERGNLHQDEGHHALAAAVFEKALPVAESAQLVTLALQLHINLAYSLTETGNLTGAEKHLRAADVIDHRDNHLGERLLAAARIAFRRGNLGSSSSLLARAASVAREREDQLAISILRARVALRQGDLVATEKHAREGVGLAERARQAQTAVELRSRVQASRRAPYELLFVGLVQAGHIEEAVTVVDEWYGRSLADAMSRPLQWRGPHDLKAAAFRTDSLGELLPVLSSAPFKEPQDASILASVRSVDMLALVVAEKEVWRLTSSRGKLHAVSLGSLSALWPRIERFALSPTDPTIAGELGTLLVPEELFRTTSVALRVVLDGPLAGVSIAALRRDGQPLVAARPVVRVPRLSAVECVPRPVYPRRAVVLADAQGNLPAARREAIRVATRFGTEAQLGSAATSAALFEVPADAILHFAGHAQEDIAGGSLPLHDRVVSGLEIAAGKVGPALVVLAACGSARASDPEGANSLAMGFLAGGSGHVLATLRAVDDSGAERVTRAFYAAAGDRDPVEGLAEAQRILSRESNTDWPNFVVFGHDICRDDPQKNREGHAN